MLYPYYYWDQSTRGATKGLWSVNQTESDPKLIAAAARKDSKLVNALLEATGADGINTDGSLQERMPFNQGNRSNWMLAEFQSATSPRGIEAEGGGRGEQLQLLLWAPLLPPLLPLLCCLNLLSDDADGAVAHSIGIMSLCVRRTGDDLNLTTLGIGERERFEPVPGVDAQKWLVRRWMTLLCDRWSVDKRTAIGEAWFNGIGVVNWQNVWGM